MFQVSPVSMALGEDGMPGLLSCHPGLASLGMFSDQRARGHQPLSWLPLSIYNPPHSHYWNCQSLPKVISDLSFLSLSFF